MKTKSHSLSLLFFVLLIHLSFTVAAQEKQPENNIEAYKKKNGLSGSDTNVDGHVHKGVYLSFSLGPCFGNIYDDSKSTPDKVVYSGTGTAFDFKVGGPIDENLILSFDMFTRSISSPEVKLNGNSFSTNTDVTISENSYGAGLTYYIMPQNLYIGGTLGIGNYTLQLKNSTTRTDYGFSGSLSIGKQWWLSRKWALGFGLIGSYTSLTNKDNGMSEKLHGPRLSLVAHISMN